MEGEQAFYHCHICDRQLPNSKFYRRKSGPRKGGIIHPCKDCGKIQSAKFRKQNPELKRKLAKKWYYKNKPSAKNTSLKCNYGITLEEYKAMLKTQNGVCAVCKEPPISKALCVDHCHKTGKIRGLLCSKCNSLIGFANEGAEVLNSAAVYLWRTGS